MLVTDMDTCASEPSAHSVSDMTPRLPHNDVSCVPDMTSRVSSDAHDTDSAAPEQRSDQKLPEATGNYQSHNFSDNLDRYSDHTVTNDSDQCMRDSTDMHTCEETESGRSRRSLRHRHRSRRNAPEKSRQKRQTLQDMTRLLKQWLYHHKENPYPTKAEKMRLANESQLSLTQVSNWFANARRRLKNTVKEPGLSWGTRIKVYNDHVTGNAELLSVSSDDSMWESEGEVEQTKPPEKPLEVNNNQNNTGTTVTAPVACASGLPPVQLYPSPVAPLPTNTFGQTVEAVGQPAQNTQNTHTQPDNRHPGNASTQQINHNTTVVGGGVAATPSGDYSAHQMCLPALPPIQTHAPFDRPPGASPTKTVSSTDGIIPSVTGSPFSPQQHKLLPLQCDELPRDGAISPKYKQTILQRYLHDSCTHSFQIPLSPPSGTGRYRHASGSVGSHDYEEISSSTRSSPVVMATADDTAQDDDLYWLEISAAMALTNLARSRVKQID